MFKMPGWRSPDEASGRGGALKAKAGLYPLPGTGGQVGAKSIKLWGLQWSRIWPAAFSLS